MRLERESDGGGEACADSGGGRRWRILAACGTLTLGAVLILLVPLVVPMRPIAAVSASYLAGFNNAVATRMAVALSAAVFGVAWWLERRRRRTGFVEDGQRLGGWFVAGVVVATAAVLGVAGWLVALAQVRYLGDAGYIIEQATRWHETGRALYTQIEFAYGPLLLLPEIWLSELFDCSMTAAYFATLALEAAAGLLMLAYVLNELPMRGSVRRVAYVLLAMGAMTPHLGLNYTWFRFASPVAVLLFGTRGTSAWRSAGLLAAGEALELLISPELGLALAAGVLVFGLVRWRQQGARWLLAAGLPLAVLAGLLLTLGRPYLRMASSFSRGALNLPVGPYPHVLVLLFALVWLVPVGLACGSRIQESSSARWMAVYATGLAFLPAALGRCDALHVFFNGVGVLVLSLMVVSRRSRGMRVAWLVCLAVLVGWEQLTNFEVLGARVAEVLERTVVVHLSAAAQLRVIRAAQRVDGDVADALRSPPRVLNPEQQRTLLRLTAGAAVATPMEISPAVEAMLKSTHQYSPGFYAFWVDVMNVTAEQRSIAEVNAQRWLLLPSNLNGLGPQTPDDLDFFQGISLPYGQRNAMIYDPGAAFVANLKVRWVAVREFGPYVLYAKRGVGQ